MRSDAGLGVPVVVLCADRAAGETVAFWLNSSGISAAIARTGYEARELLTGDGARVLITDRVLPPWPGLDTVVALKLALTKLRVAFLDDGVPDNRALARSAGADVILSWPLRRANVIDACRDPDTTTGGLACAS